MVSTRDKIYFEPIFRVIYSRYSLKKHFKNMSIMNAKTNIIRNITII